MICAFELLSPIGFPILSTTFSAWVFSEHFLLALYVFPVTRNPIDWSTFLSPTCFPVLSNMTMTTDWLTRLPDSVIGMFSVCFVEQLAERSVVCVQVQWLGNVGEGTLGVAELPEDHVVGLATCDGGVDVVGVVTPLRGGAQVVGD